MNKGSFFLSLSLTLTLKWTKLEVKLMTDLKGEWEKHKNKIWMIAPCILSPSVLERSLVKWTRRCKPEGPSGNRCSYGTAPWFWSWGRRDGCSGHISRWSCPSPACMGLQPASKRRDRHPSKWLEVVLWTLCYHCNYLLDLITPTMFILFLHSVKADTEICSIVFLLLLGKYFRSIIRWIFST